MNLEIRSSTVSKGEIVKYIKEEQKPEFIMCVGDDHTDEDMFNALANDERAFCIYVGPLPKETLAKYNVGYCEDVVNIIGQLASKNCTL
ncbi:uncharacterized protein BX663DRAFT_503980 [Cokeromyces recurvatus]|uniref:uncharacterized protein n=1 Tax=Cokeromyces recurvatus TaxID=90255 RepID=UPI002220215F|nr:uncharacterized protein BX663DRAFT_503980 [Cokeromyces recurvatus]KAI7904905.1 hypothetical protein BX663DRAFT_503980 [Cokeromyces recurvatus]